MIDTTARMDMAAILAAIDDPLSEWDCPQCRRPALWTTASGTAAKNTRRCQECRLEFRPNCGDDIALLALADWLEEYGDPRADGLRSAARRRLSPDRERNTASAGWLWRWAPDFQDGPADLPITQTVWERLTATTTPYLTGVVWSPTRSAAFLALAEALGQD